MKNADMPAMPTPYMDQNSNGGALYCDDTGLTKREMFATHAMQGITSNDFSNYTGANWAKDIAKESVKLADALLAELEK